MSKSLANPFLDFSKLMDSSKMIAGFKMPDIDMNALMEMQQKNIQMITVINKSIIENLQGFAQRQAEFIQQGFEEASSLMNNVLSAPTSQQRALHHAEASKTAVGKYIANARDAGETIAKCNSQTMETISNRMNEGVKELQVLIKPQVIA